MKLNINYFVKLPIIPQVEKLLNRPGFVEKLNSRFHREKISNENLEDIYDGSVYKKYARINGFLSKIWNMSFTWNTDGISIFRSSKLSIWPFFLQINELPFADWCKKKNIILGGVWFSDNKPEANIFLSVFREPLSQLFRGVHMVVRRAVVTIRAKIICGSADIPARAKFLNMKQHLATCGCLVCRINTVAVGNFPICEKIDT